MNIGTLAQQSGVNPKTIRYYEDIGLLRPAARRDNGYRHYADADVATVRFIKRARTLGFSTQDVAKLLNLWHDRDRASADGRALATRHAADIERRIAELEAVRRTLLDLVHRCHGDDRPHCPILDDLSRPSD